MRKVLTFILILIAVILNSACAPDPDDPKLTNKQKETILFNLLTKESAFLKLVVADLKKELKDDPTNSILTDLDRASKVLDKKIDVYLAQNYMNDYMLDAEKSFFGPDLDRTDGDVKFRIVLRKVLAQDKFKFKETEEVSLYKEFLWMTFQPSYTEIETKSGKIIAYYAYVPDFRAYDNFKVVNPLISVNILRMMSVHPDSMIRDLLVRYLRSVSDIEKRRGPNIEGFYYNTLTEKTKFATVFLFNRILLFGYGEEAKQTLNELLSVTNTVSNSAYDVGKGFFGLAERIRGKNPLSFGIGSTIYALSDKITSVKTPDGLSAEDQINFSDLQTRARQIQNTWTSIIGANIVEDLKYNAINRPFLEAASQVLLFSILGGVYNEPIGSVYKESFSSKRLGSINEISLNEVKPFDASLGGTLGTKADIFAPNITKQLARIFRQNDAMILGESDEGLMASTRAPTYPTSNGPTGIGVSVKEPVTVIKNLNTKQIIIDTKEGMALTNILKAPEGTITRNLKTVPNVSANPNPITVSNIKVTPITAGIMGVAPVKATMPEYDHDHETPDMRPTKYIVVGGQAYYPDPLYPNRWRKLYETDPNELYIFDETGKRMILDINRVLRTYSDGSTRAKIERTDTDIVLTEYFSILPTRQGSNYREEKMKLSYSLDGNGNFELKQLTIQERQQSDTNPNIVAAWEAFKLEKDQKSGTFILFSQPSGKYEFRNHRYFNNIPAGMVQDFVNKWYTNIETVTASDVKKDLENILPDIEKNSIETGHNVVEPSGRTWHIDYDYTWAPKTNNSKTNNKIIPKKGNNSNINGPRNMLNQSVNAGLYPNIPEWTHPDKLQGEESSSERPGLPSLEENTGKVEAPGSNNGIINVQDITKKIITDDGSYEEVTTGVYKKIGSPYTTTYKYVDGKMIEQGDLLHKQEKLQGPDYQIYDFVPENKRIPNDKLDFGSVYDPDSYIQPNELHPENAKPIFDKINKGVYISVGSERGFISASMTGASDLLLIDKYGGVVLYNRIKIGLISISRSKEDLRYLILKASGDEWVKRVNEYEGPLASEVRDVLTDKRNFDFFQRELRDGDDVIMDLVSGTNNYIITDYNYHFNQILYNRLKSMTNEGRISAHLVDLTDTDLMRQIADNIKARGLTIGALDISNAWGSTYKGTNSLFINKNHEPNKHNNPFGDYDVKYFEKLLLSLSNSIDPKSVLILTGVRDKGIYSSYLAFYFTYLMDNISNLRTLPNTLFLMTNYSSFIDFLYQKHPETSPMLKTDMEKLNWNNNALINPDVFSLAKYFPAKPSLADKEKTKTKLKTKKEAGKDKADKKTLTPTQPSLEDEEKTKTKLKTKKGAGKGKADKKTLTPEDQDVEDLIKNNKISNKENKIFRAFYNKYDGPEDLSELSKEKIRALFNEYKQNNPPSEEELIKKYDIKDEDLDLFRTFYSNFEDPAAFFLMSGEKFNKLFSEYKEENQSGAEIEAVKTIIPVDEKLDVDANLTADQKLKDFLKSALIKTFGKDIGEKKFAEQENITESIVLAVIRELWEQLYWEGELNEDSEELLSDDVVFNIIKDALHAKNIDDMCYRLKEKMEEAGINLKDPRYDVKQALDNFKEKYKIKFAVKKLKN